MQGDDDEGVADATGFYERRDFGRVNEGDGEVFGLIEADLVAAFAVFDQHGVTGVVHDGRVREDLADETGVGALVAGFFLKFAKAGGDGIGFVRVHHAAGYFEFDGLGAVAVLLDHDDLAGGGKGDDVHPVDGFDDVEVVFLAGAGGNECVAADAEDFVVGEFFGGAPGPDLGFH